MDTILKLKGGHSTVLRNTDPEEIRHLVAGADWRDRFLDFGNHVYVRSSAIVAVIGKGERASAVAEVSEPAWEGGKTFTGPVRKYVIGTECKAA